MPIAEVTLESDARTMARRSSGFNVEEPPAPRNPRRSSGAILEDAEAPAAVKRGSIPALNINANRRPSAAINPEAIAEMTRRKSEDNSDIDSHQISPRRTSITPPVVTSALLDEDVESEEQAIKKGYLELGAEDQE